MLTTRPLIPQREERDECIFMSMEEIETPADLQDGEVVKAIRLGRGRLPGFSVSVTVTVSVTVSVSVSVKVR